MIGAVAQRAGESVSFGSRHIGWAGSFLEKLRGPLPSAIDPRSTSTTRHHWRGTGELTSNLSSFIKLYRIVCSGRPAELPASRARPGPLSKRKVRVCPRSSLLRFKRTLKGRDGYGGPQICRDRARRGLHLQRGRSGSGESRNAGAASRMYTGRVPALQRLHPGPLKGRKLPAAPKA